MSGGSPAWAGIDLDIDIDTRIYAGFPRVGGDRPSALSTLTDAPAVPPRGRG